MSSDLWLFEEPPKRLSQIEKRSCRLQSELEHWLFLPTLSMSQLSKKGASLDPREVSRGIRRLSVTDAENWCLNAELKLWVQWAKCTYKLGFNNVIPKDQVAAMGLTTLTTSKTVSQTTLSYYHALSDFRPLRHIFVHFCGLPTAFMLHWQHYQVKRKCRQRPKWDSCFGNSQISLMV